LIASTSTQVTPGNAYCIPAEVLGGIPSEIGVTESFHKNPSFKPARAIYELNEERQINVMLAVLPPDLVTKIISPGTVIGIWEPLDQVAPIIPVENPSTP